PVPVEMAAQLEAQRAPLVEAAAESDDALLEKYLESGELSDAEVTAAFAQGVARASIVPVLATAASRPIGIGTLLDRIVSLLPSPAKVTPPQAINPRNGEAAPLQVDPGAPLCTLGFKATADPFVGRISYVKVVSGTLTPSTPAVNSSKDQAERLGTRGYPKRKALEP